MPLFLKHRFLFLHIPKCGGDTITHHLSTHGDPPFLFVEDGMVMVNGHTPQHMTWSEMLKAGWNWNAEFKVAALVRHPVDRVISEFHYLRTRRPDPCDVLEQPSTFLDDFLSIDSSTLVKYDNHNLPMLEFLKDTRGMLDPRIELFPTQSMDELMLSIGLPAVKPCQRRNVTAGTAARLESRSFSQREVKRILSFYRDDVAWFQNRFPRYSGNWSHDI